MKLERKTRAWFKTVRCAPTARLVCSSLNLTFHVIFFAEGLRHLLLHLLAAYRDGVEALPREDPRPQRERPC